MRSRQRQLLTAFSSRGTYRARLRTLVRDFAVVIRSALNRGDARRSRGPRPPTALAQQSSSELTSFSMTLMLLVSLATGEAGVKVYGLTEIGRALGVDAALVAKWRERGKLPPADAELSVGPVWLARSIEPLLESGGPDRKPRGRRPGTYEVQVLVKLGRFPAVDAPAQQRFDQTMVGGYNRGIGSPGVTWQDSSQALVTMGCMAADDDEAFDSVKSMIMRRSNNVALVAVDDVERVGVTRLGDW
jgi:hypothetical protein